MKKVIVTSLMLLMAGCQQFSTKQGTVAVENTSQSNENKYTQILLDAESRASPEGRRILATGRKMALVHHAVIRGSCWDYANAIFERAGYPREVVMQTQGEPLNLHFHSLQPGDFISYVNHSFNDIKHTAIFVDWVDYDRKIGLMLSYAGQKRKEPARYKLYDLSDVYYIARARSS
jgi:hypothetical protein